MEKLSNVKQDILKNALIRRNYTGFEMSVARTRFTEIANAMLKIKKESFNYLILQEQIDLIIKWIYNINDCNDDLDNHTGFLIQGNTGRGKTFIFRVLNYFNMIDGIRYEFNGKSIALQFNIENVKKISGEYQDPVTGGYKVIDKYSKRNNLVLDDIGFEPPLSKHYGKELNIVEEILNNRELNDLLTFGTTNLTEFSELYDDRTVSRMNKVYSTIPINHKIDFRIKPNKIKNHD